MPWKVFKENDKYCVHKLMDDGEKGEKVGALHLRIYRPFPAEELRELQK